MFDSLYSLENWINTLDLGGALVLLYVAYGALGLFIAVVSYAFTGSMLIRLGHKVGVYESETMAYIPILRDCYRMKIAGFNPLLGLLLNGSGFGTVGLIAFVIGIVTKSFTFGIIIGIVGAVTILVFEYKYYNTMLKKFGFEGTLALLIFVGLSIILEVIACIIAFSDKFDTRINSEFAERMDSVEHKVRILEAGANRYPAPQPQPQVHSGAKSSLIGIKGKYNGTRFEIGDGESVTFGREIQKCNIVFDEKDGTVSRVHCTVKYVAAENAFYVTDLSSNGTFISSNMKIGKNNTKKVEAGTVISFGNGENAFRLG